MAKIIVNTQAELNAIAEDFLGEIHIVGIIDQVSKHYKNAVISVYGNAQISNVYGNAQISNVDGNAQISNVYGNAQIRYVDGNAQISNVYGNAQIRYVDGNAQIRYVDGNAQISNVDGNAQISNVYGNAQISNVYGNAQIRNVDGNAQIRYVDGNAQISNVYGNAQIRYVYGNAQISNVDGNAQIRYVDGNAQIRYVDGNAQISNVYGNASILHITSKDVTVETSGQNIISYDKGSKPTIKASKNTTIVVLNPLDATLESYMRMFPVKEDGKKNIILYKAVHKKGDRYIADWDKSTEYKVGETKKGECNPSTEKSCTTGLHVSHLHWAMVFGRSWEDLAILEVSVPKKCIVVAKDCDGKIRTSELTVIRELPKSEL